MNGRLVGSTAGLNVFEKKEKLLPVENIITLYRLIHGRFMCSICQPCPVFLFSSVNENFLNELLAL
jgi:hypothetical protein